MSNALIFEEIYGRMYRSFHEFHLKVTPGKHLVIGENRSSSTSKQNGAGKSTLFTSVSYTGYKKIAGKRKDP